MIKEPTQVIAYRAADGSIYEMLDKAKAADALLALRTLVQASLCGESSHSDVIEFVKSNKHVMKYIIDAIIVGAQ